jgi:predicted Zn-ribbon and HTH transcriptional regulator
LNLRVATFNLVVGKDLLCHLGHLALIYKRKGELLRVRMAKGSDCEDERPKRWEGVEPKKQK